MTKIRALVTLHANGKHIDIGQELDVKQDEAESLVERGFAQIVAGGKVDKVTPNTPAPSQNDIIDAILQLDPKKDYGKNGVPDVKAIEKILGVDITAQQRDLAWAELEKETSGKDKS